MAVSNSIYKVYRMAAKKRLEDGEELPAILESMSKLSQEQKDALVKELTENNLVK